MHLIYFIVWVQDGTLLPGAFFDVFDAFLAVLLLFSTFFTLSSRFLKLFLKFLKLLLLLCLFQRLLSFSSYILDTFDLLSA